MKENINALDEVHKGCCMGIDAINFIYDKVEDDNLRKELEKEKNDYEIIKEDVEKIYPKYNNDDNPHETGVMTKAMTWSGIEMKTLTDNSNSKIAELLLQGVNMGIIEGRKILNHKTMDKKVHKLCTEYIMMQEKYLEKLKDYL